MEAWVDQECSVCWTWRYHVHSRADGTANCNISQLPVRLLSPLVANVSDEWKMTETHGWEMADVSGEQPWSTFARPKRS